MDFSRPSTLYRKSFLPAFLLGSMVLTTGCPRDPVDGPVTVLTSSVIRGELQVPPVVSSGTGSAIVEVSDARDFVVVNATTQGLINEQVIAAHIHAGLPGENGPIILPLYDREIDGEYTGVIERTLTEEDFLTDQTVIPTFDDAISALLEGETYINFHTVNNPAGEIRGHIGQAVFAATLNGNHVIPPLETPAQGSANVVLGPEQNQIDVVVSIANLNAIEVTEVNVHVGQPGTVGPVVFPLYDATVAPVFDPTQVFTVTADDLIPQPNFDIVTFDDAVLVLLTEGLYINVRTVENPQGEIRGRIFIDNTINTPR